MIPAQVAPAAARFARSTVAAVAALCLMLAPAVAAACNCPHRQSGSCGLSSNLKLGGLLLLVPFLIAMTIFLVVRRVTADRERARRSDENAPR